MSHDSPEYHLVSRTPFDPFVPPETRIREYDVRFTAIEGLSLNPYVDVTDTFRSLKKKFGCGGALLDDPDLGEVILLQGNHRSKLEGLLPGTEGRGEVVPRFVPPIDIANIRPQTTTGNRGQKRLKSVLYLTSLAD